MKNKILVVTAMFYEQIGGDLFHYASKTLEDPNTTKDGWVGADVYPVDVPGVFEIPVMISRHIHNFDGAIALGCVIKGETPHFEFISKASIDAIMKLSIEHKKPIGNGIITCLNKKQAIVRSKTKGQEAAKAVIGVLNNF